MVKIYKLYTLAFIGFGLSACWNWHSRPPEPEITSFSTAYKPSFMSRTLLENSISMKPARTIVEAGKIYLYGNYIFINEKYKGFHVIDNTNDSLPVNVAFINIPGSLDVAIKDTILYADNATDLVAINVADINDIKVTKRNKNTFLEPSPPDGGTYTKSNIEQEAIIVGWTPSY